MNIASKREVTVIVRKELLRAVRDEHAVRQCSGTTLCESRVEIAPLSLEIEHPPW